MVYSPWSYNAYNSNAIEEGQYGKEFADIIHEANVIGLPGSEGVSFAK